MTLKKILMIGVFGVAFTTSMPARAALNCGDWGLCFFFDPFTAIANYVLYASGQKLRDVVVDVHDGLEKIKENIGMYQPEKCGRSATGASGCSMASESSGAATDEAGYTGTDVATMLENAKGILEGNITEKKESDGSIKADKDAVDKEYLDAIGITEEMDTFDQLRTNVEAHVFKSDIEEVNASCTCSQGTGSACSSEECAEKRQNHLLVVSSTGASAAADGYLRGISSSYESLKEVVDTINGGSNTVADYVGNLGLLTVRGASTTLEQMAIMNYDLRAQSYRNVIYGGVEKVDVSNLQGGN